MPPRLLPLLAFAFAIPLALSWRGRAAAAPPRLEFARHEIGAGLELNGLVAADFDGDGRMDFAAAGPEEAAWYGRKAGERDWTRHLIRAKSPEVPSLDSICMLARDMDGDGDADILYSTSGNGTLAWHENPGNGDGEWKWHLIDRIPGVHSQVLEDLDGDGQPEIVANTEGMLVYYAMPKDIRRAAAANAPTPEAGPHWERKMLSRDGVEGTPHYMSFGPGPGKGQRLLCAAAPDAGYLAWWAKGGEGEPWAKHTVRAGLPGPSHLRIADINGDGKPDLFFSQGHAAGSAWLAGPEWTQEHVIDPGTLKEPHALDLADLDGNGSPDIAAVGRNSGGLVIWLNRGNGEFDRQQIDAGQTAMDVRIRDLDGDGDADILVAGAKGKNLVWYENRMK